MPSNDPVKVSFADIFKSSKTIRQEMAAVAYKKEALAARSRRAAAVLAAKNGQSGDPASKSGTTQSGSQMIPVSPSAPDGASSAPLFTWYPQQTFKKYDWPPIKIIRLLQLKEANAPLAYISLALNVPVEEIERRWKLIQPDEPQKKGNEGKDKGKGGKEDKQVKFAEPVEKGGKKQQQQQQQQQQQKKKGQDKKNPVLIDENLTLEEVLLLNRLANRYDQEKWLRISSRFFDKTGKRLSPEEAKKHVEQEQKSED